MSFRVTECRNTRVRRLRGVHTAAHPNARKRREFPSQVWALLHSFTDFTPHGGQHRDAHPSMLRPRFLPLQRFASHEEPLSPGGIPTHRLRCALRVSHPLGALLPPRPAGLVSSRFRSWGSPSRLVPARCRTPSRAPDPSGFWLGPSEPRLPFRDRAHHADPARGPGV
jgi:hypothetical protein